MRGKCGREGGKGGREGREGGREGREGREGWKGGREGVWNDISCLPACHVYHVNKRVDVFHRPGIRHFHLACEMAPLVVVLHYVNTRVMHREVSQTIPTSSICSPSSMQIQRRKAWEIWSHAVMSGRQRVDTQEAMSDEVLKHYQSENWRPKH